MTPPSQPAVSVLMAVYNGARWLPETMDCLLRQTFRDFELVIVDDASTDTTPAVLDQYAKRDGRVVVLRNEQNLKLAGSLNRGLRACRAPWIARSDADDLYDLQRLEKQVAFLREHPEVDVVSAWYHKMRENGELIDTCRLPVSDREMKFTLLWESPLCHAVSVYRRELVLAQGGYDETYWTAQDYELWSRLAGVATFANVPEPLMKVRYHEKSTIATRGEKGARLGGGVSRRLLTRYMNRPLSEEEAVVLKRFLCAYGTLDADEYDPACRLVNLLIRAAMDRESPEFLPWVRARCASAALKHSEMLSYTDPDRSLRLLKRAMDLSPSVLWRGDGVRQMGRLFALGPWRRFRAGGAG